jgi:hypothetical protein
MRTLEIEPFQELPQLLLSNDGVTVRDSWEDEDDIAGEDDEFDDDLDDDPLEDFDEEFEELDKDELGFDDDDLDEPFEEMEDFDEEHEEAEILKMRCNSGA